MLKVSYVLFSLFFSQMGESVWHGFNSSLST